MANPPVQIGELSDVPAPQSPVGSNWANEVSNRIVHRFTTAAELGTWTTALEGTHAVELQSGTRYVRLRGQWVSLDVDLVGPYDGAAFDVTPAPAWFTSAGGPMQMNLPYGSWLVSASADTNLVAQGWGSVTLYPATYPAAASAGGVAVKDSTTYESAGVVLQRFNVTGTYFVESTNLAGPTTFGVLIATYAGSVHVNGCSMNAVRIGAGRPGTFARAGDLLPDEMPDG